MGIILQTAVISSAELGKSIL